VRCTIDARRPAQRPALLGADDPIRIAVPRVASRPRPAPRTSPRITVGSILVGAGAGLAGLTVVAVRGYTAEYMALRQAADNAEAGGASPTAGDVARSEAVARMARGASIGLGVAAVAVLATGVALLVSRRHGHDATRQRCKLRGGALACTLPF
jgi:hypothetical protein